jgi:hypothetical protein
MTGEASETWGGAHAMSKATSDIDFCTQMQAQAVALASLVVEEQRPIGEAALKAHGCSVSPTEGT